MNRDKIEEMAKDIPSRIVAYNSDPKGRHLYIEQRKCIAEELYNAGYRKASDVAREIFAEIDKHIQEKKKAISMFKDGEDDFYDGEIHALEVFAHLLANLKKKYESEGEG